MKKISWLIAVATITTLFFQCQKEVNFTGGPDTGGSVNPAPVKASLQGNITDENNQPAAGVTVTAGTGTTTTDASGYFRFTNASLDKNTSLVTASKNGYFVGYRVFAATSGCNQVAIKLIKKTLAGSASSSTGGDVNLPGGGKVSLPASGVVIASSNGAYSGDVKVSSSYINPSATDISKTMPGSTVGNSKDGRRVVLSSYGMLAVELSSAGGEKLQIKSGSTATLTIPISSALTASAPATIPLWYLDETTGIWQQEGTATKQGNNYVGEVKHFSFWSAANLQQSVNLSLTLQTPNGQPIVNGTVQLTGVVTDSTTHTSYTYGYTDSLGQVQGAVPANTSLTLDVIGTCGTSIYTQNIPALTQDKNLGIIKITDNTSSLLTVTGTLADCNNAAVTNGYAVISFNGTRRYVSVGSSGAFTTTYVTCPGFSTTIYVSGVDAAQQTQSAQASLSASLPVTDAGTIVACGNTVSDQYINYTIDGTSYSITSIQNDTLYGSASFGQTNIFGEGATASPTPFKLLKFYAYSVTVPGDYDLGGLYINNASDSARINAGEKVTFTKVSTGSGDYYQGHFDNISYYDSIPTVRHTISATFKVKQN